MKKTGYEFCQLQRVIIDKKDAHGIIQDPIQITFISIEFHRPAMDISGCVRGPCFGSDSRHAKQNECFLSSLIEKAGRGDVRAVCCCFKFTICTLSRIVSQYSRTHHWQFSPLTQRLWHEQLCIKCQSTAGSVFRLISHAPFWDSLA